MPWQQSMPTPNSPPMIIFYYFFLSSQGAGLCLVLGVPDLGHRSQASLT